MTEENKSKEQILTNQIKFYIEEHDSQYTDNTNAVKELYDYYNMDLPGPDNGITYVHPVVKEQVDHYLALFTDIFTQDRLFEIIPDGVTSPIDVKVISEVIHDVFVSNHQYKLFNDFGKEAFIAGTGILYPYVCSEKEVLRETFGKITEEDLAARVQILEEQDYVVEFDVTKRRTKKQVRQVPSDPTNPESPLVEVPVETELLTGTIKYSPKDETKRIKISNIKVDRLVYNANIDCIDDQDYIGHWRKASISELLEYGFPRAKVQHVARTGVHDNDMLSTSMSRNNLEMIDLDDTEIDLSLLKVKLYEVYVRSSLPEDDSDEDITQAKLYKVFYCGGNILEYEEVQEIPYVMASPFPTTDHILGGGIADAVKGLQNSITGSIRSIMINNINNNNLGYFYDPEKLWDADDISLQFENRLIPVKSMDAVTPILPTQISSTTVDLISRLEPTVSNITGIVRSSSSLTAEVFKQGGSSITAQLALQVEQSKQKYIINNLIEYGLKPLVRKIYTLIREHFSMWEIDLMGKRIPVNPSGEWPRNIEDVRFSGPLGRDERLQQAMVISNHLQTITGSQNPEMGKVIDAKGIASMLKEIFHLQGMPQLSSYIQPDENLDKINQLNTQITDLNNQIQQKTQSETSLQQQVTDKDNNIAALQQQAGKLQYDRQELTRMAQEQRYKIDQERLALQQEVEANKQYLAEQRLQLERERLEFLATSTADKQSLEVEHLDLKKDALLVQVESGNYNVDDVVE